MAREKETGFINSSTIFYTSQFGYKIKLEYAAIKTNLVVWVDILEGEYDGLLKWPFSGIEIHTVFDQSHNPVS